MDAPAGLHHAIPLTPLEARAALLDAEVEERLRRIATLDRMIEGRHAAAALLDHARTGAPRHLLARLSRRWRAEDAIAGSGLFAAAWYGARYADRLGGAAPLDHFRATGLPTGLQPNPFFDPAWYASTHAQVAESGQLPLLHYIAAGARQALAPGPLFDSFAYLARYPELAEERDPLAHYLTRGLFEGRTITPPRIWPRR